MEDHSYWLLYLHRDRLDLHGLQLQCHNLQQRLVCCFQVRNQKWKHGILFSQNGKKYLGATILEKPCNFTLTCDKNGNVS